MLFSVHLPAGTKTLPYSDLPLLITEGKYGPREALDENVLALFGAEWVRDESELEKAVKRGEVELLDSSFYPLCPSFTRGRLERAVITVDALRCYLERINGALVVGEDAPEPQATTPSPAPLVAETVEQRRARYLAMFEAEEKREKRGALQRVADSEGVDRSNMKKDIDKARAARDEQKRAGAWTSQLVQRR